MDVVLGHHVQHLALLEERIGEDGVEFKEFRIPRVSEGEGGYVVEKDLLQFVWEVEVILGSVETA